VRARSREHGGNLIFNWEGGGWGAGGSGGRSLAVRAGRAYKIDWVDRSGELLAGGNTWWRSSTYWLGIGREGVGLRGWGEARWKFECCNWSAKRDEAGEGIEVERIGTHQTGIRGMRDIIDGEEQSHEFGNWWFSNREVYAHDSEDNRTKPSKPGIKDGNTWI